MLDTLVFNGKKVDVCELKQLRKATNLEILKTGYIYDEDEQKVLTMEYDECWICVVDDNHKEISNHVVWEMIMIKNGNFSHRVGDNNDKEWQLLIWRGWDNDKEMELLTRCVGNDNDKEWELLT
jgi:hypothetical protein